MVIILEIMCTANWNWKTFYVVIIEEQMFPRCELHHEHGLKRFNEQKNDVLRVQITINIEEKILIVVNKYKMLKILRFIFRICCLKTILLSMDHRHFICLHYQIKVLYIIQETVCCCLQILSVCGILRKNLVTYCLINFHSLSGWYRCKQFCLALNYLIWHDSV